MTEVSNLSTARTQIHGTTELLIFPAIEVNIRSQQGIWPWQPLLRLLSWCPIFKVKSLQLIWRSGTRRFHLRVPDLRMSCRVLTTWQGTRIVVPAIAARWTCPTGFITDSLQLGRLAKLCHSSACHIVIKSMQQALFQFNTLKLRQNRCHFADDTFKCVFLNENVWISIKISLTFVSKGPISYIPALVQMMAWRRPGDKPSSEPIMVRLLTHVCVTRPQWVKTINWYDMHVGELIFKYREDREHKAVSTI